MLSNRANHGLNSAKKVSFTNGTSKQHDAIAASDPSDYYQVRISKRSSLSAVFSGLQADIGIALLNRKGRVLQSSVQGNGDQAGLSQTLKRGTYFIQVLRQSGDTSYTLKLSTNAANQALKRTKEDPLIQQVTQLTNQERAKAGLPPLKLNPVLSKVALGHSEDMANNDFFSHTSSSGSSVFDRIKVAGYTYSTAAENIAAGQSTPEAVVAAWMNSPGHRANILSPSLTEIGVGFYFLKNDSGQAPYHYYWTQDFGTPMQG